MRVECLSSGKIKLNISRGVCDVAGMCEALSHIVKCNIQDLQGLHDTSLPTSPPAAPAACPPPPITGFTSILVISSSYLRALRRASSPARNSLPSLSYGSLHSPFCSHHKCHLLREASPLLEEAACPPTVSLSRYKTPQGRDRSPLLPSPNAQ